MKHFSAQTIGVQQGSHLMFSDYEDDGVMWAGQGARERRHLVAFSKAFMGEPAVSVSISMLDVDQKNNLRADVATDAVTKTGFQLVFKTWGDTSVARVRLDWMAIGRVKDEDDWDL